MPTGFYYPHSVRSTSSAPLILRLGDDNKWLQNANPQTLRIVEQL